MRRFGGGATDWFEWFVLTVNSKNGANSMTTVAVGVNWGSGRQLGSVLVGLVVVGGSRDREGNRSY